MVRGPARIRGRDRFLGRIMAGSWASRRSAETVSRSRPLRLLLDGYPTDHHGFVDRVIQLVGLGDASRGEHVHSLWHGSRIGGAVEIRAGIGTHAELERLR